MSAVRDTSRRYTTVVVLRARELRAAGWSYRQIRDRLDEEQGVRPALTAITRWCDPVQEQRARERQAAWLRRRSAERASFALPGQRSSEWVIAFIRRLDAEGVNSTAIAGVLRVLLDEPRWNRGMVDGVLAHDRVPHLLRSAA